MRLAALLVLMLASSAASAHSGHHGFSGFIAALEHLLTEVDHLAVWLGAPLLVFAAGRLLRRARPNPSKTEQPR
jgi:hydrogenase/urease accessory protein HupE